MLPEYQRWFYRKPIRPTQRADIGLVPPEDPFTPPPDIRIRQFGERPVTEVVIAGPTADTPTSPMAGQTETDIDMSLLITEAQQLGQGCRRRGPKKTRPEVQPQLI